MPMDTRVPVLEVRQLWGETLLDTRHFRPSAEVVRVGDRLGWRWELLGVDMGFVPEPLHKVLPWLPPIWSEVAQTPMDDFVTDEDALGGSAAHALFRYDEDLGWLIHPPGGPIEPVGSAPICVPIGQTRFEARVVSAAVRPERPVVSLDRTLAATFGLMAGVGVCFGILVATAPPPAETLVLDSADPAFEALLRIPPQPPEVRQPKPVVQNERVEPQVARSSRGQNSRRAPARRGGNSGLGDAEKLEVRQAGLFAGGALDELLGHSSDLASTLVSASRTLVAKGDGGHGLGINGMGDRAGWLGDGGGAIVGVGGVSPWGDGGPPGAGDDGFGDGEGKRDGVLDRGHDSVTIGGLSPDQVDRVVKNHLQQIRYCYQRELTRDPSLTGKLSIGFTIASDGTVSAARAKSNTVASQAVESCVVARFLQMQFPKPEGGGIAIVTYPFLFAPG